MQTLNTEVTLSKSEYEALISELKNERKEKNQLRRKLVELTYLTSTYEQNSLFQENLYKMVKVQKERQNIYLQLMLDNSPDISLVLDINQKYILGTKNAMKRIGINTDALNEKYFCDIFSSIATDEWIQIWTNKIQSAIDKGIAKKYTAQESLIKGKLFYYEIDIIPFMDEKNTVIGAMLYLHNTTELQEAIAASDKANRSKSSFLAKMSHEIRTPMNAIIGMAELIVREEINPAVYEYALSLKMAGANLLAIINDILDFSKIESGKLEIVPVEYQLASLMNDVISIIRMRVIEKPIFFSVNTDCNLPSIMIGDEIRIRQILLNLLSNACKYCNEGFIAMTVGGEIIGEDTVLLIIEIADSGIGIKAEDMHNLFDDFSQIDRVKNRGIEGTGLGLAITINLCQAMGGDVSVRSVYGEGSVFTVKLPQTFSRYEKFAVVKNPTQKSVLIYETRLVYANSIVCSIDNLGVSCTMVTNQSAFCEELEKHSYSYVFAASFLLDNAKKTLASLGIQTNLVLLYEFGKIAAAVDTRMLSMPAHSISIANILNDVAESASYNESFEVAVRFTAPTARILVVDDISTNLKVAEGLLLPYKTHVDVCKSGMESIRLVKENQYDIVFMDQMMPEMDGIEATLVIRSLEGDYYKKLPIVAVTANAVSGIKEMFLQNGFNDFLAKPIETIKLNEILENWVPKEKQQKSFETKQYNIAPPFEIDGVNVKQGISMTGGSIENYMQTLEVFSADCLEKINEIAYCLDMGDIANYTIHVHALKSASSSIGAVHLSGCANSLELAGQKNDINYIRDNNTAFTEELKALIEQINQILPSTNNDKDKTLGDYNGFISEASNLAAALNDMDLDLAETILSHLQGMNWDSEFDEALKAISRDILLCEYDDALELIDVLLSKLQ